MGVSRDICSRLKTEFFERVSVGSIKQKEGALPFGFCIFYFYLYFVFGIVFELFEKVSAGSIKQEEGALYFGHVQGENYTSAL